MSEPMETTLTDRVATYGAFDTGAALAQELKGVIRKWTPSYSAIQPYHVEAFEMICTKLSRIFNGDLNHADSWRDIAGYALLVEQIITKEVLDASR
jgi:hypothetical protein